MENIMNKGIVKFIVASLVSILSIAHTPSILANQDIVKKTIPIPILSLLLLDDEADPTTSPDPPTSPLNDTGITWGGDYPSGNNVDCMGETISQQDCSHGRDATHNDDSDGHAGFSFTKLDPNGNALAASASSWSCVKDNVTGLIWEVKTDDNGIHDKDNTYRWGGKTAQGSGFGTYYPDWDTLVDGSNNASLCGYTDWRVPTRQELEGLVNFSRFNPSIDMNYFPNTPTSVFWSASPIANVSGGAWDVSFNGGNSGYGNRDFNKHVRLVRSGQ
jgi:hypothetical protein